MYPNLFENDFYLVQRLILPVFTFHYHLTTTTTVLERWTWNHCGKNNFSSSLVLPLITYMSDFCHLQRGAANIFFAVMSCPMRSHVWMSFKMTAFWNVISRKASAPLCNFTSLGQLPKALEERVSFKVHLITSYSHPQDQWEDFCSRKIYKTWQTKWLIVTLTAPNFQ